MRKLSDGRNYIGKVGLAGVASGSFTHAAGTIAGAGGTVYTVTSGVADVQIGDILQVAPNYNPGTATVEATAIGAGTVVYRISNPAGTVSWGAGTVNFFALRTI